MSDTEPHSKAATVALCITGGAAEQVIVSATVILGTLMLISFVAETSAGRANLHLNDARVAYRNHARHFEEWMCAAKVPFRLRRRMQTYQSLSNPGNKIFREAEILGHLSAPLQQELQLARHLSALRALGLVDARLKTSSALAGRLSAVLERRIFLDGEVLVHQVRTLAAYFIGIDLTLTRTLTRT